MNRSLLTLAAVVFAASLAPAPSHAQAGSPFDHLKCYKIKDPQAKTTYQADLDPLQKPPFSLEPGCIISVPAKLFCIPVDKTNVQPAPLPVSGKPTQQDYLLYKIKCPVVAGSVTKGGIPVPVTDQFGARTIKVGKHSVLLVPAFKTNNLCHAQTDPAAPMCAGDCQDPNQKCVQVPGTTQCTCESPCSFDGHTGQCGGLCPFADQNCHFADVAGGTACTCDPVHDGCTVDAAGQCTGVCPRGEQCVIDAATGSCGCETPCTSTGIRMCGGWCPKRTEACLVKPDDSGCECRPSTTPCGMNTAGQCAGDCPNGLPCVPGGPVPGPGCICG